MPTKQMDIHTKHSRPLLQQHCSSDDDEDISREEDVTVTINATAISTKSPLEPADDHNNYEDVTTPNDEDDDDEDARMTNELLRSEKVPKDKYSFNYVIFYLLGMTMMLPWNFFITAEDVSIHFC